MAPLLVKTGAEKKPPVSFLPRRAIMNGRRRVTRIKHLSTSSMWLILKQSLQVSVASITQHWSNPERVNASKTTTKKKPELRPSNTRSNSNSICQIYKNVGFRRDTHLLWKSRLQSEPQRTRLLPPHFSRWPDPLAVWLIWNTHAHAHRGRTVSHRAQSRLPCLTTGVPVNGQF